MKQKNLSENGFPTLIDMETNEGFTFTDWHKAKEGKFYEHKFK